MMRTDHQGLDAKRRSCQTVVSCSSSSRVTHPEPERREPDSREHHLRTALSQSGMSWGMSESWFQSDPSRPDWGTPQVHKFVHQASSKFIRSLNPDRNKPICWFLFLILQELIGATLQNQYLFREICFSFQK